METGVPKNVRHVAHVTFDRFEGFLGLPDEFEPEVSRRPPSASKSVFGVSMESMQLSFDSRGNSVPTILLMMQKRLYAQGGLQVEGIFRITGENSEEEYIREQLNGGVIPDNIDVHCLAGLIKAWFRELPTAVLDSLSPEKVMQSQSEEECTQLIRLLPPTEFALLDWAINLMADVAELGHLNKMDARNIALVFAPNMTKMSDPLTALMYAVKVMNFLKTLIVKKLQERQDSKGEASSCLEPSDENGHHSSSEPFFEVPDNENEQELTFVAEEPSSDGPSNLSEDDSTTNDNVQNFITSNENLIPGGKGSFDDNCHSMVSTHLSTSEGALPKIGKARSIVESSYSYLKRGPKKVNERQIRTAETVEKSKVTCVGSHINSRFEGNEAWR